MSTIENGSEDCSNNDELYAEDVMDIYQHNADKEEVEFLDNELDNYIKTINQNIDSIL